MYDCFQRKPKWKNNIKTILVSWEKILEKTMKGSVCD